MRRITDPEFVYVPAVKTDLAKTFKLIIAEQKRQAEQAKAEVVQPFKRKAVAK